MANKHEPEIPVAIESLVGQLDGLSTVFGPAAVPVVAAVKESLLRAMAARDRGDSDAAFGEIGTAMNHLSRFADRLDPTEGQMMRAVANLLQGALQRRSAAEAEQAATVMFERSGARPRKRE